MKRLLLCAVLALAPGVALAQAYPAKPVRIVIPFPPGGGAEGAARFVANRFTQALGQPFLVEPRPGGNTVIGTEAVAKSPADGYTLLVTGSSTMSIQPFVFAGRLPYDPLGDFAPVGMVSRFPFFIAVPAALKAGTLQELVALAKANPGQLSYASNGTGTIGHLGTEMLRIAAGIDVVHIPYKGFGPALPDLIAGRVAFMMADVAPIGQQVRAGNLRVIAATSAQRSGFMPEVPTVAEQGFPGYELEVWFGLYAPAKTPPEIVAALGAELRRYLASPQAKEEYARLGHDAAPSTPEEVRARIVAEQRVFGPAVKAANLKPQ